MNRPERKINPTIIWALAGIFLLFGATARAAVINVTAGDAASLSAAVNTANTNGDASNTINVPAGNYVLTAELVISAGVAPLLKDLTINGGGAVSTTIRGGVGFRIFNVQTNALVYINNLSVLDGNVAGNGGGILNNGACYLFNVAVGGFNPVSPNAATAGGGGIYNNGYLNIENSTITSNIAPNGGGIYNDTNGYGDIINSTISGNVAGTAGGGIYNANTGIIPVDIPIPYLKIYNTTITDNLSSAGSGAGIATQAGIYLVNTIVAVNSTGGDCSLLTPGINISGNNNLESGTTCNFTQTFDIQNTNPLLGPLAVDLTSTTGTATHALQTTPTLSPAINRGNSDLGFITTDQRGVARAVQYDIGAYESDTPPEIDLSVFKAGPSTPQEIGVPFTFNIQVHNNTTGTTAAEVIVTDTLDPKLSFILPAPAGCVINGQTITCTIGPVVGGSFLPIDIPVVAIQGGTIENTVSVALPVVPGSPTDPIPSNNSDTFIVEVNYALPAITSLDPASKMVKDPGFTLTVIGSNFADAAVVRWNGADLLTSFVNETQLTAEVPSQLLASPVAAEITVFNPDPGGGLSNTVIFNVYNLVPVLDSISPSNGLSGGLGFKITLTGNNFVDGAAVMWNGTPLATTFFNSGLMQAFVHPAVIPAPGVYPVQVVNPAPSLDPSNTINVTIVQGYHYFFPASFNSGP